MRSATVFLPWLFFYAAAAPANAQSPAAGQEVVPVEEQAAIEDGPLSSAVPLPLHVQPVTSDASPVSATPLHLDPPRSERPMPVGLIDKPLISLEVVESGAASTARKAGGGILGFPDHYAVATDSTLSITDPAVGLLKNDIDRDGETLTVISFNHSDLEGDLSVFSNGRMTYTPPDGFAGTETFTYRMRDASFNQSDHITVTINVYEAGRSPIGTPDRYSILTDSTLAITDPVGGLLSNDIDLDGETLTVISFNHSDLEGDLSVFSNGRMTYTPPDGFAGTETFTYRMRGASNNFSDDITVTIDVFAPDTAPVGIDDAYSMLAGTILSITDPAAGLLKNDIDRDGETLTVISFNHSDLEGDLSLFSDGRMTYTPPDGFAGTESFTYRMRDASNNFSDNITVTIDVYEANRAPLGTEDVYATLMDSTLSITDPAAGLLANDIDLDGETLAVTQFSSGSVEGDLSLFSDGRMTYTPPDGFAGTETFTYRMRDASFNQSDHITVTIHVLDPAAAPLPVELTSFEAQVDGDAVVLRWTTLTETNNAGFEVEQRRDSTWTQVGFAEGFGTTTEPREYAYRIDAVAPGRHGFRLKQIDYDGGFAFSPEVEVHMLPTAFRLAANYPNPFSPSTTITFEVPEPMPVRVVIYDVLGRRVATLVDEVVDAGRHNVVWDGRDAAGQTAASGLYLYRMEAGAFSQTKRMMLVK